jgi:hypothetical protein
MNLMLRYTQALLTQTAQTAVCNRHHTLDLFPNPISEAEIEYKRVLTLYSKDH